VDIVSDKVNILLVDDQPARLLTYEAILATLGETLVPARSGEEALKRLMESEYAVILLDVSMPGMDGFETAEMIHRHPRFENTPIIFVTGVHVDELDRLQGYRLGAIDYVQVPMVPDILRGKVAVLVELYRKRHALSTLNRSLAGENANLAQANLELQMERAKELEALSETLSLANAKLSAANRNLEAEVNERRRAEEHSLRLAGKLRELDRRKDVFLATLAHELRNPLAPILSALSLLRHSHAGPDASAYGIEVIDRQLRQLVRLVDDLLDVSRIAYDRIDLRRERMVLATSLAAAIEMIRPHIDAKRQRLSVELPTETLHIDGDPQRIAQVFGNLLSNASKYSDEGGSIELAAQLDHGIVTVVVRDDGIGIPPERIESIFELFYQVDTSLERAQGGLGIGLTLVKRLVEMHGGEVRVESEGLGRGSKFAVQLPLLRDAVASAGVAAESAPVHAQRRVLVIDDNRDAADMLAMSLVSLGHDTRAIYDPMLAIDAIRSFAPEIAFVDIGMPKLSGLDLARMIRANGGNAITLIALTGWGQAEDRDRSRNAGFDCHFVKPISLEQIERVCQLDTQISFDGRAL
jgi:signal transduction histidine kinase